MSGYIRLIPFPYQFHGIFLTISFRRKLKICKIDISKKIYIVHNNTTNFTMHWYFRAYFNLFCIEQLVTRSTLLNEEKNFFFECVVELKTACGDADNGAPSFHRKKVRSLDVIMFCGSDFLVKQSDRIMQFSNVSKYSR